MAKLILIALFFNAIVGCDSLPAFPSVETKLIDNKNDKIHRYELPKKRGVKAPYLGSIALSTASIEKHFCFAPSEYSKIEQYISEVEDVASRRCK